VSDQDPFFAAGAAKAGGCGPKLIIILILC
jgi:hypothetical protein